MLVLLIAVHNNANMGKIAPHDYQPPIGESIASLKRRKSEQSRGWHEEEKARQKEAVSSLASKLALVSSVGVSPFTFEVVSPVTSLRRMTSLRRKERMIPAETRHLDGKSTLGGWVDYWKLTANYLDVTTVAGYHLEVGKRDRSGFTQVITVGGKVGSLLKPQTREWGQYTTSGWGNEGVQLLRAGDDFAQRDCEAVWAPSLVPISDLSAYRAGEITQVLDALLPVQDHES